MTISITSIMQTVGSYYGVTRAELIGKNRAVRIARPRQVVMYLCRELSGGTLPRIGRQLGGYDHTTILHGCRRIAALCRADVAFAAEIDRLRVKLVHAGAMNDLDALSALVFNAHAAQIAWDENREQAKARDRRRNILLSPERRKKLLEGRLRYFERRRAERMEAEFAAKYGDDRVAA